MILEVLGSGGSIPTPKILCNCEACSEARELGIQYYRLGPSVFIHGPNILIDTPEEISVQINRAKIKNINTCLYSHWHPDHTAGRRVFEAGIDYKNIPPQNKATRIILTEKVAETFEKTMGLMDHFNFMESKGIIEKEIVMNDQKIIIDDCVVQPVQLAQSYVFGYIIKEKNKKILVIMDELKDWNPSDKILEEDFELVYLPFGLFDYNPITNTQVMAKDHYLMKGENTIGETLEIMKKLNAKQFILSHIEESDSITRALANKLEKHYSKVTGKTIRIAYDSMKIEV
jgi:phosphoribosyl 1,2-cyclic phosphate phosphodiesterase